MVHRTRISPYRAGAYLHHRLIHTGILTPAARLAGEQRARQEFEALLSKEPPSRLMSRGEGFEQLGGLGALEDPAREARVVVAFRRVSFDSGHGTLVPVRRLGPRDIEDRDHL